jgi:hypothetical protein
MLCEQRAKDVLDAWIHGDRLRIGVLTAASGDSRMTPDEQERMELLESIGTGLHDHDCAADAPATAVSIRLLRHLASAHN